MNNKISGNMLVKELLQLIANKELKVKDVALHYGTSDRTIQSKIKKLGFTWESKERKYVLASNDESVYKLKIDDVFANKNDVINKSNVDVEEEIKNNSEEISVLASEDNIDMLLSGNTKKAKKEYRGFYFDSDVLKIIDGVNSGAKSELVNECLRRVFKDKGLL